MKLWFPWCICISKLQFSTFLWMCFRKPLSLLGAKHKKAAATQPIKKRWDGLLLCLVHAGFSKKCKEERALGRHYPCFISLATKTPYTIYDYVTLIWTKFTRCCWKHLDGLSYMWLPAIVDDPNLVSSQSVRLWDQQHNQKTMILSWIFSLLLPPAHLLNFITMNILTQVCIRCSTDIVMVQTVLNCGYHGYGGTAISHVAPYYHLCFTHHQQLKPL
jgi:hypothetical protein